MSLKERLRNQASRVEEDEERRRSEAIASERYYLEQIRPAMQAAAIYFRDVVTDLEIIQPKVSAMYAIGPSGAQEVPLNQDDYRVYVDDDTETKQVSVNCNCEFSAPVTRYISDVREGDEFEKLLRDMGAHYYRRREQDLRGRGEEKSRFTVEGSVRAGFIIAADLEGQRVIVETHNLEDQPRRFYVLKPERVTETLFESLGKLLLREQDFVLTTDLDPEIRRRLRQQIDQLNQERELEMQRAEAEEAEAERAQGADRHARLYKTVTEKAGAVSRNLQKALQRTKDLPQDD